LVVAVWDDLGRDKGVAGKRDIVMDLSTPPPTPWIDHGEVTEFIGDSRYLAIRINIRPLDGFPSFGCFIEPGNLELFFRNITQFIFVISKEDNEGIIGLGNGIAIE